MKYRHSFHAGNFADVHKHVTLLALLAAVKRKETAFLYLETHAGRGCYTVADSAGEASRGFGRLASTEPKAAELCEYLQRVRTLQASLPQNGAFPGSPLLAAECLRAQDRAVLFEILPGEARALEETLQHYARVHIEQADGFERLRAYLPPPERRALVFIDPPYEERRDFAQVAATVSEALKRFPTGILAAWYPIKDQREIDAWHASIAKTIATTSLVSQLWIYPRDSRVSLNGSGLLIVNPPYQLAERMALWLPELHGLLDTAALGGTSIHTLSPV